MRTHHRREQRWHQAAGATPKTEATQGVVGEAEKAMGCGGSGAVGGEEGRQARQSPKAGEGEQSLSGNRNPMGEGGSIRPLFSYLGEKHQRTEVGVERSLIRLLVLGNLEVTARWRWIETERIDRNACTEN